MSTTIEPFRDKQTIKNIIMNQVQKNRSTVHGQESINRQLPKHLNRKTKDVDVFSKKPEKSAKDLAKKLNKEFNSKEFTVKKGVNKKTFKVKRNGQTVADFTATTRLPKTKKILGISFANLESQARKLKKIVKKPELKFRHEKDKGTLASLKKHEMTNFLKN